jgi:hypothetical protein
MRRLYFGPGLRGIDVTLGIALPVVISVILQRVGLAAPLYGLLCKDGTTIYGSLVATLASLLGFAIAAISIVVGLISTPKFAELRGSAKYGDFWKAFTWTIQGLGCATLICLIAIFLNVVPDFRMWVLLGTGIATTIAVSSLLRSGVTLIAVLDVARTKPDEPPSQQISSYRPAVP